MLYYPQLTTGSISQYPVSRKDQRRTVINVLADGSDLRTEDAGAAQVTWDLTYTQLTTAEFASIEHLFDLVEGRLGTFTFLDPTDNLLTWSEELSQNTWTADPLIRIEEVVQDPLGSTGAAQLTNTAQTSQKFGQTIAGASWFQYCFSVYVRADAACTIQMIAASHAAQFRQECNVGPSWIRAVAPVLLASQSDGIYFGLELPAGCRIAVFAPQVEAQSGAGPYKKTTDRAGVYTTSRFDSDGLLLTTTGLNQHSCSVRVKSCVAG